MPTLFGYEFTFNQKSSAPVESLTKPTSNTVSFVPPDHQDGAVNVSYGAAGGYFGYYLDLDGTVVDDFSLINRYRQMQTVAEVDEAISQIINEMVVQDADRLPVELNLDYVDDDDVSLEVKARLIAEFNNILKMMNFHKDAYSSMRQWYIDGRLYYHCVVDEKNVKDGIQELRIVDPRTIRKVREVARKRHPQTQADIIEVVREYYVYNPMGFVASSTPGAQGGGTPTGPAMSYNGIRVTTDAVAFCPSGFYDSGKRTVLSWMHKAIKPLNLLSMIEDSCVIYRVSRAPERRVFYIDVGNLPKAKAEQYLHDIMQRYRNKLVYDVATGEVRDDRKFMSVLEDFWLPRREGGTGTEITTLPAGQNLSQMEDVEYFRKKLYRALGLPPSRTNESEGFALGRATEITRDELNFTKFIHRLQTQFGFMFDQLLEKQLRLKNVMTEAEWHLVKDKIRYTWQQDSYFEELKTNEVLTARLNLANLIEPFVGRYYSQEYVQREILRLTDDEMAAMKVDIAREPPPVPEFGMDENGEIISGDPDGADGDFPFDDKKDASADNDFKKDKGSDEGEKKPFPPKKKESPTASKKSDNAK